MFYRFSQSPVAVQSVLLATCAFAFLILSQGMGFDVVMRNYYLGGHAFINGQNPYEITLQNGPWNQFKYSPLFALIMGGLAQPTRQGAIIGLWLLTGMAAFSFGLSRWCDLTRKAPTYIAFALLAGLLDLVVSMSSYQANALIAGLVLLGVAEYRDGRFFSAGAMLLLASNFKVYPTIFLIALALRFRTTYWIGALSAGVVAFLLPALFVGWSHNLEMHIAWFHVVLGDAGGDSELDLLSAFQRIGLNSVGLALRWLVLVATIPTFFAYFCLAKRPDWRPWMTFGLASLLLLSPKTEVFTYVLLAPSYVLMASWCAESPRRIVRSYAGPLFTILAVAIASCRYIDPEWWESASPYEVVRVIGAMGYWVLTAGILGGEIVRLLKPGTADSGADGRRS